LLLQREIPEYVNIIAARTAKEAGTIVILDMGGRDEPLSVELIKQIDIISPNEVNLCFHILDRALKGYQQKGRKS